MEPVNAKPRLRGVPDLFAAALFLPAVVYLSLMAQAGAATRGAVVYGVSVVFLFAMSTTYHVPVWSPRMRGLLRRADHVAIYLLIAGSYTPACLYLFDEPTGTRVLWIIWGLAAAGTVKSLLWPHSPRWFTAALYVGMGWVIVPYGVELWDRAGPYWVVMMLAGGVLYTFGAVVYARKWFDFQPKWFGHHEVFHLFVIAAALCHYAAMWHVLVR